jgi:hypothetical protein
MKSHEHVVPTRRGRTIQPQGVVFPIPVLTDAEVRCCRSTLEELDVLNGDTLKRLDNMQLFFRWAYRLATHDAVESIHGDDVLIDGTLVLCKYPDCSNYVSWHHDSFYSGGYPTPSKSAWNALSPSTARRGVRA